ncbi:MAG: ferrous iron transport protein A [Acidobacteria bacterium]|nr:ferrous iron transport protein A [Acidobacteriota bacterium]
MLSGSGPSKQAICDADQNSRILNSDQSGRSFRVLPFRRRQGVRRVSVLTDLRIGETATLISLDLPDSVQNYLMHMGFVPDAQVTALRKAPAGDPTVYAIDGMEIALRRETAKSIQVRSNLEASRREIDAELDKIAVSSGQAAQAEINEFAGATR